MAGKSMDVNVRMRELHEDGEGGEPDEHMIGILRQEQRASLPRNPSESKPAGSPISARQGSRSRAFCSAIRIAFKKRACSVRKWSEGPEAQHEGALTLAPWPCLGIPTVRPALPRWQEPVGDEHQLQLHGGGSLDLDVRVPPAAKIGIGPQILRRRRRARR